MATSEQIYEALKRADELGNVEDARRLALAYQESIGSATPLPPIKSEPLAGIENRGAEARRAPPKDDAGYLSQLGAGLVRGSGSLVSGFAKPIEELPAIARSMAAAPFPFVSPALNLLTRNKDNVFDRAWREAFSPTTQAIQKAGEKISGTVAPRVQPGVIEAFTEEGPLAALKAAGVSLAESSVPTLGALGTALVTKSPAAAMGVMGLTSAPQTYTGIRESQKESGIDDVQRAVLGTAVSSAFDVLTGQGAAVSRIGGRAVKEFLESGVKAAAKEILKTGAQESGTEILQNVIEQVAGGVNPTTKQSMLQSLEAGAVGLLGGTVFGGASAANNQVLAALTPPASPETTPAEAATSAPTPPPPGAPPPTTPALRTVTIGIQPDPEAAPDAAPVPTPVDILSEPDAEGNVFVRFPDGGITQAGVEDIESLAIPEPEPVAPAVEVAPVPEAALAAPVAEAAAPAPAPEPTVATSPEPIDVTAEPSIAVEPTTAIAPPSPVEAAPAPPILRPAPTATMPPNLSRAAPSYAFGPKQFGLTFDNDIDKAAYIATSGKPSKRRAEFADWLSSQGLTEPEIADIGGRIRDGLKDVARSAEGGQRLNVPAYYSPPVTPAPEAAIEPEVAVVEPSPEIVPFTAEAAAQARATDLDLIPKLKGKTVSGAAQYLEQNASAPIHRQIAARARGMIDALERQGIKYTFGIAGRGGEMPTEAATAKKQLAIPGVTGVNVISGPRGKGTVTRIDVAVRGRPLPSGGSGVNEETLLHELIHAASAGTLRVSGRLPKGGRAEKAVADLKRLHTQILKAIPSLTGEARSAYDRLSGSNAFKDADELIAWGLTNYDMQQVLKAIPVENTNAFTKFVEIIGNMLGIGPNDRNALRSLIEITEDILPTEAAAQQDIAQAVVSPETSILKQGVQALPEVTTLEARQPMPTPTPAINPSTGQAAVNFTLQDENLMQLLGRQWADKLNRLRYAEKVIGEAAGAPIPRAERSSELADLLDARAQTRIDDLERDHIRKITDLMEKEDISLKDADYFLLARSAPARNLKIATINPAMPDGGSGITTAQAQAMMAHYLTSGQMPKLRRLGKLVDKLAQFQRDTMVEYGLISRERADALAQEEPYYVPLKGLAAGGDMSFDGSPGTDVGAGSRGFSISPKEYRMAKGRGKSNLPNSPLATLMSDAQRTILRGERNRVGQSFLNDIALKYPSRYWQVYTDANPDTYQRLNPNTGLLETVPKQMDARDYFVVKENGVPSYIKFNDPILERAMLNLSAKEVGDVTRFIAATIGAATRVMSRLHTTLQPEFMATNFLRDVQAAIFSILAEQGRADGRLVGKKILSGVMKDARNWRTFVSLMKATFNRAATNPQQAATAALFQQAKEDGAFTGWVMRETPEEQYKKIQRALDKATATGKEKVWYSTLDGAKSVVSAIEDFNSVFENVIRFSVYKNALDAGLSRDEAANMARKVTVDFGRKGEFGPIANSLYAFFNATIQGNVALLRALTNVNFKQNGVTLPQKIALASVVLGASLGFINAALSDEDDDGKLFYDKIPDYEKERNLIIMNPFDGRTHQKLPMSYGYSLFPTLGANIADVMRGEKTAGDLGMSIVSGLINNFSPIQRSGETLAGMATSVVPTVFKPLVDLAVNENFFGGKIYNKPFNDAQAQSSFARYSTPEAYKAVVRFLNEATGGKGKIKGDVDWPAEGIEYALTQYIGGVGNLMLKTVDLGGKVATGREVRVKDVPMVRRLIGEPSDGADLGEYYDRVHAIAVAQRELKDADSSEERRFLKEKYPVNLSTRVIAARKTAESKLRRINEKKKALSNSDIGMVDRLRRMDELNDQQHDIYLQFNRVYNEVKRGR